MSAPAYESYKDSGVAALGSLPSHWRISPAKYALAARSGGASIKGQCADAPDDSLFQGYSASGPDVWLTDYEFDGPGLVLSAVGARCGKVFLATGKWGVVANTHCLLPLEGNIAKFLWYLTNNEAWWEKGGTAQPFVKVPDSLARKIGLPPPSEQTAIAAFLDRETGKIDALIEAQTRLIELLKEKRQAVIFYAVTKGLNPDAPMKDSGIEWLGQVPAHWDVARLKQVAKIQTGVAKGKDYGDQETEEVPFLRVANVQDGWVDLRDVATIRLPKDDINRYQVQAGDVLMNEGGDYDKLGRGTVWQGQIDPCVHQNHVFAVRPQQVDPEWLDLVTSSQSAQFFFMGRSKQSTNLASISSTNLMELPLTVPPVVELREIVGKVNAILHDLTMAQSDIETGISLLHERRAALISAAVTGKIDVRGLVSIESEAA